MHFVIFTLYYFKPYIASITAIFTSDYVYPMHVLNGFESYVLLLPKEKDHPMGGLFLVETTGLEPVTSCV